VEYLRKAEWNAKRPAPIQAFADCKIFGKLSLEEIKEIATRATPVRYRKGKFIFQKGDPAEFFYVVQEGSVKLHSMASSGKTLTFDITTSGDVLNGSALSTGKHFVSAQALTDVTVLRIAKSDFFDFVSRYPKLALEIIHLLSFRLQSEYRRLVAVQREEALQRVCACLLSLCSRFGTTLHVTREELADFAGTATETTVRVLSRLKKMGIVSCLSHRREILIADLDKLRAAAGMDDEKE
jgi:CRP/FNR family transcriptional regulator, cyclic AMP receptor protein